MPTPANAINNSIDLLGWPHTIGGGGRRKNSSRYSSWRTEVEVKIKAKGWQWKKDAGNSYDAFLLECIGQEDFPSSGAAIIRQNPKTDDTKLAHKALNELMLDCFKKVGESRNKWRRAAAREDLATEAGKDRKRQGSGYRMPTFKAGRPVVIYILNPDNQVHHPKAANWNWNIGGVKKLAVLYQPSLNDLHIKVSTHLPDGRKVREIVGALNNAEDATDVFLAPTDVTHIRSDDELDAFLRLSDAKPIKLLVILHRDPAIRANTPPPQGSNINTYYFNLGRFDGPEYYVDELENSDEEVAKQAGSRKGVPRKDHKFEQTLEDFRRRIRHQQRLLASMKEKHKAAFPEAIHESDAGGKLRVKCYGQEDKLSGKQVVRFREVIADYIMDLAARLEANNGLQTKAEMRAAALAKIKADINGGVTYAHLNLPETLE
ncbi:hypothetical protein EV426DRAFT_710467 [Tirmania nivea]|nr:hypothetical protein EV426DRAFT_710467 [Tirmania nivea]